jgi:S1-C subfamily serine protease
MRWAQNFIRAIFLGLIVWRGSTAGADEITDKGREILAKYQHAVVTVEVVTKLNYSMSGTGSQGNEIKQDLTGTVVDPSGLTVLALSSCDPGNMMQAIMSSMSEDDEDSSKVKMDTEIGDVKVMLEDGTELPAEVVLRDKELDLAFIRPKSKPATPMAALDLNHSAKAGVLDPVITLNRLGQSAGRAYAASVERITAVVQKPRLFYIPGSELTSTTLGSPAFTLDGNVIGLFVLRTSNSKNGGMNLFSGRTEALTPIIVPAADVAKAAQQALAVNADSTNSKSSKESKDAAKKE